MMDHINEWFACAVGGVSPARPGYEEIRIKPSTMSLTDSARYSLETIRGIVKSQWARKRNDSTLNVTIPANTAAKIYLPSLNRAGVTIREGATTICNNGISCGNVAGVRYEGV